MLIGSCKDFRQHSSARSSVRGNRWLNEVFHRLYSVLRVCLTSFRALATHAEVLGNKGQSADKAAVVLAGGGEGGDAVADLVEQGRWQVIYRAEIGFGFFLLTRA